ncbi:MAG: hypothetical protein HY282_11620 [Nitrospirae bacterium]|nr:hypothetical protein [Candidatus Manganitrophaceae bacterium]
MYKKIFLAVLLAWTVALTGCHMTEGASVRADYYGDYPYRRAAPYPYYPYYPYYNRYYDPFLYPAYVYDPYPYFFFGGSFIYGTSDVFIVNHHHRSIGPGSRSLRGFRGGGGGTIAPSSPSQGGGGSSGGSSGGGRSLR